MRKMRIFHHVFLGLLVGILPDLCSAIDIKSSNLKLTNWDREKFIFDHNYSETAKRVLQKLIYDRPEHERYVMPLMANFQKNPTLTIGLHFRLIEIVDLDTENEEMKLTYTLTLYWYDYNLAWYKPETYNPKNSDLLYHSSKPIPKVIDKAKVDLATKILSRTEGLEYALYPKDLVVPLQSAALELEKDSDNLELKNALDYLYPILYDGATELRPDGFYKMYDQRMQNFTPFEKHEFKKLMSAQFITVPSTDIWVPDILIYNSNQGKHFPQFANPADQTTCTVFNDGLVIWEPIISHTVSCDMSLGNFPFDVQMCFLDLGSWYHNAENVNIKLSNTTRYLEKLVRDPEHPLVQARNLYDIPIDHGFSEGPINSHAYYQAESDLNHGEWQFIAAGIRVGKESFNYKSWVRFYIMMKRQPLNYMLNVGLTCLFLIITSGLAFYIPADSDRLNLIFSILLTMAVYQMIIVEYIPKGTPDSPILSIFILIGIIITNICACVCMALIRLHKYRESGNILMNEGLWSFTIFLMKIVGAGQKKKLYCEAMVKLQDQLAKPQRKYYYGPLRGLDSLKRLELLFDQKSQLVRNWTQIQQQTKKDSQKISKDSQEQDAMIIPEPQPSSSPMYVSQLSHIKSVIMENLVENPHLSQEEILDLVNELRGQQFDLLSIVINRLFGCLYIAIMALLCISFSSVNQQITSQIQEHTQNLEEFTYTCSCQDGIPVDNQLCHKLSTFWNYERVVNYNHKAKYGVLGNDHLISSMEDISNYMHRMTL